MGELLRRWRVTAVQLWRSQATTAVLGIAFVVCALGWWLEVRPLAPEWGPIGTWVGGIATSLGLVFTGQQIREARLQRALDEQRRRDDEGRRREAMARSVSISSSLVTRYNGRQEIEYAVVNGSDYPIDNVVVRINDPGGYLGSFFDGENHIAREIVIGTMFSKQQIADVHEPREVKPEMPFLFVTGMASVRFTDTWDQSWDRGPGLLETLDAPPRMC